MRYSLPHFALLALAVLTPGTASAQPIRTIAPGITRFDVPAGASNFGSSLAMQGNLAVVGAPFEYSGQDEIGAAYLYRYEAGAWRFEARLQAWGPATKNSRFGSAVDASVVDGIERVAIGAPSFSATSGQPGAVYMFRREANGAWAPDTVLHHDTPYVGDRFGISASMDGARMAVGQRSGYGSVSVFDHTGGSWQRSARVVGDSDFDQFGYHLSLFGDRIAMGTILQESFEIGRAFVLAKTAQGWGIEQRTNRLFSYTTSTMPCWLTAEEMYCLPYDRDGQVVRPTILRRGPAGWVIAQELTDPASLSDNDAFRSVLLDGETLVVPGRSTSTSTPPDVVYRRGPERWERRALLHIPPSENVSYTVQMAVGKGGDVVLMKGSTGAVYAFDLGLYVSAEDAVSLPVSSPLRVTPNPARSRATVACTLSQPGPVTLRLFDVIGREVLRHDEGPQPAGPLRLSLDVSVLPGGLYFVRVTARRTTLSTSLVVR